MTMYFDGSKCELEGGVGFFVFIPQGVPIPFYFKLTFPCTNNNVEYETLILGLRITIDLNIERIMNYGDSLLFINQVLGVYKFHNEILNSYKVKVIKLLKFSKTYRIDYALRYSNQFANTMASLGSLIPPNPHQCIQHVEVMTIKESSLCHLHFPPSLKLVSMRFSLSLDTYGTSNFMITLNGMPCLPTCFPMRRMLSKILVLSTYV